MKYIVRIIVPVIFLAPDFTMADDEPLHFMLFKEEKLENRVYGGAVYIDFDPDSLTKVEAGVSFSEITANHYLSNSGRDRIRPFYGFMRLGVNYYVSPYMEAGIDLGDLVLEDLMRDEVHDEDVIYHPQVDTYYAAGISIRPMKNVTINGYIKTYYIYYGPSVYEIPAHVKLKVAGVGIGIGF